MSQEFLDYLDQNDFKFISLKNALTHLFGEKSFEIIQVAISLPKGLHLHTPVKKEDILKKVINDLDIKIEREIEICCEILDDIIDENIKSQASENSAPLDIKINVLDYYHWLKGEQSDIAEKLKSNEINDIVKEIRNTINRISILKSALNEKNKNSGNESKSNKINKNSFLKEKVQSAARKLLNNNNISHKATKLAKRPEVLEFVIPDKTVEKINALSDEDFKKCCVVQRRRIEDWIREEISKKNLDNQ